MTFKIWVLMLELINLITLLVCFLLNCHRLSSWWVQTVDICFRQKRSEEICHLKMYILYYGWRRVFKLIVIKVVTIIKLIFYYRVNILYEILNLILTFILYIYNVQTFSHSHIYLCLYSHSCTYKANSFPPEFLFRDWCVLCY